MQQSLFAVLTAQNAEPVAADLRLPPFPGSAWALPLSMAALLTALVALLTALIR